MYIANCIIDSGVCCVEFILGGWPWSCSSYIYTGHGLMNNIDPTHIFWDYKVTLLRSYDMIVWLATTHPNWYRYQRHVACHYLTG